MDLAACSETDGAADRSVDDSELPDGCLGKRRSRLLRRVAALPGVKAAGGAMPMPFSGSDRGSSFTVVGQPPLPRGNHPVASHLVITSDYFRAMRIPLLAGRLFDRRDTKDSVPVMIVNETFAKKFFPNANPLGQHVQPDVPLGKKPVSMEIIGVVGDSRHESLAIAPKPEYYIPIAQEPARALDLVVRTSVANLSGLNSALRRVIEEMDREVFVPEFVPLNNLIGGTLAQPRFNMVLLGSFAGVVVILAAIGIDGVIAYSVSQRTREIGIRMALGAQRRDVLRMILRQSMIIIGRIKSVENRGNPAGSRLESSYLPLF